MAKKVANFLPTRKCQCSQNIAKTLPKKGKALQTYILFYKDSLKFGTDLPKQQHFHTTVGRINVLFSKSG